MATSVNAEIELKREVDVPPLELRATVVPESVDEENRTVDIIWTTGARVLRASWDIGTFEEELSLDPKHVRMDRLNSGAAPLLNTHSQWDLRDVIGVVESGRLQKKQGTAKVRFAKAEDDPDADKIFRKVKDKIIRNVSVGYRVHRMEKVDGGDDKVPVYRVTDWTPYEISIVPIGADAGAMVRSATSDRNSCVIVTRTRQEMTMDNDTPTTTQVVTQSKESPAVVATKNARAASLENAKERAELAQSAAEEATAKERSRVAEIRKIAKRSKLGDEWAQDLIEAGTTVEDARAAAFEGLLGFDRDYDPDTSTHLSAGEDERDKQIRGASAWLFQRTGTRSMLEQAQKKYPDQFKGVSFDPGEFRGMSPIELARHFLERGRVNTRGMDRMRMVGLAFTQRSANYQTAGDFPTLFENVLGKVLLGSYATQTNTWELFCKREEVPDFRTTNRYRSGSLPGLDVLAEHAEYKNGIVPDGAKYPLTTQRMGKMFGISQETIINDDMGALTQMATELGKAAQRSIENAVYALLALNGGLGPTQSDGQPFFHANRANVNATGSAISVDGLEADAVVMASQKDPNGQDFIDLQPAVLVVPRALRGSAHVLNNSEFDTSVSNKFQVPNKVRGLFRQIVASPRLTGTRRYLIADTMDAIVVAFLEGAPGPVIDTQNGWRVDGTEFKVTLYAKAQMGDPKAAVTNAGA